MVVLWLRRTGVLQRRPVRVGMREAQACCTKARTWDGHCPRNGDGGKRIALHRRREKALVPATDIRRKRRGVITDEWRGDAALAYEYIIRVVARLSHFSIRGQAAKSDDRNIEVGRNRAN